MDKQLNLSQKRALTAVYFQMDTRDLAPLVQPGGPIFEIESVGGGRLVVFGGGVLLTDENGEVVGGVGVSAGGVEEDHDVAAAGAAAF